MGRQILIIALLAACIGCRSSGGWNPFCASARVPPPPTGSYGVPNSYYQPGAQSIPTTSPPAGARASLGPNEGWKTVRDAEPAIESRPRTASAAVAATSNSPSSESSSSKQRLKGMRINEARAPAEPREFTPDGSMAELKNDSTDSAPPPANRLRTASAAEPDSPSARPVSSAHWQSR